MRTAIKENMSYNICNAGVYAKLLYTLSQKHNKEQMVLHDLVKLRHRVQSDREVQKHLITILMSSIQSKVTKSQLQNIMRSLQLSVDFVVNFLLILAQQDVLYMMYTVIDEYIRLYEQEHTVTITTYNKQGIPSVEFLVRYIEDNLTNINDININYRNDKTIIAGYKIRFQDYIYDKTMSYFIQQLRGTINDAIC